jgi:putative phosphoesterase
MFITHGHHFSVKLGLTKLLNHALYNDVNIVCFGHTHRPLIKEIKDVLFINPGSLSRNKFGAQNSYCLLEITKSKIDIVIKSLSGNTLMEYTKER